MLPFAGALGQLRPCHRVPRGPGSRCRAALFPFPRMWDRAAWSRPCPPGGHGGCGPQGDFEGPSGRGKRAWRAAPGSALSLHSPGAVGLAVGVRVVSVNSGLRVSTGVGAGVAVGVSVKGVYTVVGVSVNSGVGVSTGVYVSVLSSAVPWFPPHLPLCLDRKVRLLSEQKVHAALLALGPLCSSPPGLGSLGSGCPLRSQAGPRS